MCDTLCVRTGAGLIFAKNSDRPPDEAQTVRSFARRRATGAALATQYLEIPDRDASALVGSQPSWLWGLEHGVNEHGLVIGNEKVWTTGRPRARPPALLGMDIVRLALERARTADEALAVITDLIEAHGQGGSGERDHDEPYDSSFLVADRVTAWIIETSDRTWAARATNDGVAISNRISLGRDWSVASADVSPGADFQAWRNPKVPTSIADHRLRATTACISRPHAEPADLLATLRDHGTTPIAANTRGSIGPIPSGLGADNEGVTVCMHAGGVHATTASMVVAVPLHPDGAIRAWCALGSPCVSVYVPVFPFVAIPAELAEVSLWARFGALRDRAEAQPDALVAIRARLTPVEQELWATAGAIADDDHVSQRRYAETALASLEPALEDLAV